MEENNAPVEQTQPTQNEVAETPTQETNVPSQEVESTQVETLEATPETETTEKAYEPVAEIPEYDITQYMQPAQAPEFTTDDSGYIDPKEFYNRVMQDAEARIEQRLRFQESEKKLWASVESKYPEIKEDSELRDILNNQRIADVANGGKGDLNKIADRLLGKIQSYQAKGKVQAQVSEKIQKSAALESSTANTADTNKDGDLMERMSRGDQQARNQLIADWLASGKI
jgi:hypothetical protein